MAGAISSSAPTQGQDGAVKEKGKEGAVKESSTGNIQENSEHLGSALDGLAW